MYMKMNDLTELCIFIQCWRAIAYSGAAPEVLRSSVHAACKAGCFGMLLVGGRQCQPVHKSREPGLSDK